MSAVVLEHELLDSNALIAIAQETGISFTQATLLLQRLAALPGGQGTRIFASAQDHLMRAQNAATRRANESEARRRRQRSETT